MTEWIKCSERLPRENELVWIFFKNSYVEIGQKTAFDCAPEECWYSLHSEKSGNVNYWMPIKIPDAPGDVVCQAIECPCGCGGKIE
jgi:hypothetical protein